MRRITSPLRGMVTGCGPGSHFYLKLNEFFEFLISTHKRSPNGDRLESALRAQPPLDFRSPRHRLPLAQPNGGLPRPRSHRSRWKLSHAPLVSHRTVDPPTIAPPQACGTALAGQEAPPIDAGARLRPPRPGDHRPSSNLSGSRRAKRDCQPRPSACPSIIRPSTIANVSGPAE